jgi:signal transduction histidine kinase
VSDAIAVPLSPDPGNGLLVVFAGPYTPLFGSDEVARLKEFTAVIRIALERVAMTEKLQSVERMKSQFLNLASHELRTPLSVIRGYLSIIEQGSLGELPGRMSQIISVLTAKGLEMNMLVEQMLEAARLEEGRLDLKPERVDLCGAASDAVELVRPLADSLHPLVVSCPTSPLVVAADRARLSTILTNLLDNAIKYSPDGGEVRCEVRTNGSHAQVAVIDHGLGISPQDQLQLFTRFGRIMTPENRHIPGTGLGLYLARELARQQEADITVESAPGRGSTFVVSFPLHSGSQAANPEKGKAAGAVTAAIS